MSAESGRPAAPPIHRHATLDSTNSEAFRLAEAGAPHLTAVSAEFQTAGRGQPGREWWMPEGQGALISVLARRLPPGLPFGELTQRAGWAMARALEAASGAKISIKPPNDLLIGGKKVGGILCEARWKAEDLLCAVLGVGVNVNVREFPEPLRATATSLAIETGRELDRAALAEALIEALREMLGGARGD